MALALVTICCPRCEGRGCDIDDFSPAVPRDIMTGNLEGHWCGLEAMFTSKGHQYREGAVCPECDGRKTILVTTTDHLLGRETRHA